MSRIVKQTTPGTTSIATTSNTDEYLIAPQSGRLVSAFFTSLLGLTANDTNYVTFSITNLGQGGAGTAVMLAATAANTTKATGGTTTVANAKRALTVTAVAADKVVVEGDVLLVRFAVTGTLGAAITRPMVQIGIKTTGQARG